MQSIFSHQSNPIGILEQTFYGKRFICIDYFNCTPHIETSLEIGLRICENGGSFTHAFLGSLLPYNEGYDPTRLTFPGLPRNSTYEELLRTHTKTYAELKGHDFHLAAPLINRSADLHQRLKDRLRNASSLQDLNSITDGPMQIGLAIASSLAWRYRSMLTVPSKVQSTVELLAHTYKTAFDHTLALLNDKTYDYVVLFNGRFCPHRASQDAAASKGVRVLYHERGSTPSKFSLRPYPPHKQSEICAEIMRFWEQGAKTYGEPRCTHTGKTFYERKRMGDGIGWKSFVSKQRTGAASRIIDRVRRKRPDASVAVYFQSSDDEYVSAGEDIFPPGPFGIQQPAFDAFIKCAASNQCQVVVRLHPHMAEKNRVDLKSWIRTCRKHGKTITLVLPSSQVSTYELIDKSDFVVTYHSTTGIEAIASGKPLIVLGRPFYEAAREFFLQPSNHNELNTAIRNVSKTSVDRSAAYPYGYWAAENGITFNHFKPDGLFNGSFLGVDRRSCQKAISSMVQLSLKRRIIAIAKKVLQLRVSI